ncbi:uncharacterized protein ACRADG_012837 [Cochliomyia hominivorax]
MFKIENLRNNILRTLKEKQLQNLVKLRPQSTITANALDNDQTIAAREWENAKPFEEIPTIGKFTLLRRFLPGGKYANLDSTQIINAYKRDIGNVSRIPSFFGRREFVITHNVEDFENIYRNEGIWPNRPSSEAIQYHRHVHRADFFQGVEGLISTQGESWGSFRTAVNPIMMQPKNVSLYMDKMSQVNKEFVERIRQIRDPKTFEVPENFVEELHRFTLESVAVVALDKHLGLITKNRDNPVAKELSKALNDFFIHSVEVEFKPSIWRYYKTPTFKKLMKSLDQIVDITGFYINEAIERIEQERKNGVPEKPDQEKSVLEKLIKIDKRIASVMAMDMLMAGVDTTTSTLTGLMLCLSKNPDKQKKLREEVLQILPQKDSDFNENSLKNLPYLRACIKESLRLYPLLVGSSRAPINDMVVSGYRIPKGTPVTMIITSLPQNPKHYPRPQEYLPERWLRPSEENENSTDCPNAIKPSSPFLHLPFGFGARSCIGKRMVQLELELAIARLVRNFHIAYDYPADNAFKSLLINVPNIPLKFKFKDLEKMFNFKKSRFILNNTVNINISATKNSLLLRQSHLRSSILAKSLESSLCSESLAKKEYENYKPFEEIPTIGKLDLLVKFLPGGKYANLDTTQLFNALKQDLGNVVRFPGFFGGKPSVLTHNVEDFENILRNEGMWPERPGSETLQYYRHVHRADFFQGIEGLISTQGETWGTFRSAVNPVMMQPKTIRLYMPKMAHVNKELVKRILQIRDPQTLEVPDNFKEVINRFTLESIAVVALDKQLGLISTNSNHQQSLELFRALNDFFRFSWELDFKPSFWRYYKTPTFKKLMATLDKIVDITSSYVNEAIERFEEECEKGNPEKPEQEKSVLEKLIKIDKRIATVMAMDMLMAGVDTTSSTLTGLLLCLAKNPDKQKKLRQEVLKALPQKDSEFNENAMKNMSYVRACLKESLRYYPLIFGNARVPVNDVIISGYKVPKGSQIAMCITSVTRDPKYYPHPNQYLPERWLRSNWEMENNKECPHALRSSKPFVHLPFGFGPRSCIGRRIVEMELELCIARLVRHFQIEFNYPTEKAFKSFFISTPNIPLKFKFTDLNY